MCQLGRMISPTLRVYWNTYKCLGCYRDKTETVLDQQLPPSMPEIPTFDYDLEKTGTGGVHSVKPSTSTTILDTETLDIEHVPVQNDPRKWSPLRKNTTLALIASASMILSYNIQNPAVQEMEAQLPATPSQFIKGRKLVYFLSLSLFTLGTIIVALTTYLGCSYIYNLPSVIGFRCMQAAGSSAEIAIGAATLADIFDPAVRGKKMGIYYTAPLLGPAVGSIFGGVLTSAFNWRAIFWFLSILSGLSLLSFVLFFPDTFRRERSLNYQNVIKQRRRAAALSEGPAIDIKENKETALAVNLDLSLADVNPLKPLGQVLRQKNNIVVLISSGFQFAFSYLISYTSARTLSTSYGYSPLKIGLEVSLVVWGGRWSDYELARLKLANSGKSYPEMRLRSTLLGTWFLPPCVLAFGWVCAKHVHISALCVFLFLCGFFLIWSYSSTMAYLVDANNGRSSTAVATNSAFRGISAFVATEVVVPLQDDVGDGWLYTIWAGLMLLSGSVTVLVWWKGGQWREAAEAREAEYAKRFDLAPISDVVPGL
ncbi:MFS general substrate transporter [Phlegmacium glaucopus]|nr:MFS general substrate transporter [Phlegmacium glaucopus]